MTDPFQEQISDFVDDELSSDECEFFVRRLQRDPEARERLIRYHLIGAAMRGELERAHPNVLRHRLQDALNGVSRSRETPVRRRPHLGALVKPAIGVAIAAGVAAVAVVTLQTANVGASRGGVTAAAVAPLQAGERTDAESYVVPRDSNQWRLVSPPIQLTKYLMHHSEYASHLSRTSVHSNVVVTGQPAMTEIEVEQAQVDAERPESDEEALQ